MFFLYRSLLAIVFTPVSVQSGSADLEASGFSNREVLSENGRPVVPEDVNFSSDEDSSSAWLDKDRSLLPNLLFSDMTIY